MPDDKGMPDFAANGAAAAPRKRQRGFDVIRLAAAIGVVVSHSFPLGLGKGTEEPLAALTQHQMNLGELCVAVFFILSGYLITRSWDSRPDLIHFVVSRVLRIMPALAAVIITTSLVLGPLLTVRDIPTYFTSGGFAYLTNLTPPFVMSDWLPGVFSANPYPDAINGSLWTLRYEVAAYGAVALLGIGRLVRPSVALFLLVVLAVLSSQPTAEWWMRFGMYFAGGSVLWHFRDLIVFRAPFALLAIAGIIATMLAGVGLLVAMATLGAYLVVYFAAAKWPATWGWDMDLSYGAYVWAWPVSQAMVLLLGGKTAPWLVVGLALPVTLCFAAVSWTAIEAPALRKKELFTGKRLRRSRLAKLVRVRVFLRQ